MKLDISINTDIDKDIDRPKTEFYIIKFQAAFFS